MLKSLWGRIFWGEGSQICKEENRRLCGAPEKVGKDGISVPAFDRGRVVITLEQGCAVLSCSLRPRGL